MKHSKEKPNKNVFYLTDYSNNILYDTTLCYYFAITETGRKKYEKCIKQHRNKKIPKSTFFERKSEKLANIYK